MKPGEGRLAKCLGDELNVEGQAGSKGAKMSEGCKKELISFKIQRSTNINMDLPLAKACKADAEKFCANKYEVGCEASEDMELNAHRKGLGGDSPAARPAGVKLPDAWASRGYGLVNNFAQLFSVLIFSDSGQILAGAA